MTQAISPSMEQIKMNGGFKITDGRGNIKETEEATKVMRNMEAGSKCKKTKGKGKENNGMQHNKEIQDKKDPELVKPIVGNGLFNSIGDVLDNILGTGLKGGINTSMPIMSAKITEKGAGIFGDVGEALDDVGEVMALGKKAPKYGEVNKHVMKPRGKGKNEAERQQDIDDLRKRVIEMSGGFKDIQKLVKKLGK